MSIATYGLGLNGDTLDYASVYGFGVVALFAIGQTGIHLYVIEEELRLMPVMQEIRDFSISKEDRIDLIGFENRIYIIPKKSYKINYIENRTYNIEFEDRVYKIYQRDNKK